MLRPSSFLSTSCNDELAPQEDLTATTFTHQAEPSTQHTPDYYNYWNHVVMTNDIPLPSSTRDSDISRILGVISSQDPVESGYNGSPNDERHRTYTDILNNMLYNKRYDNGITLGKLRNQPFRILNYLRPLYSISLNQALPLTSSVFNRVITEGASCQQPKDGPDTILTEFEEESRRLCALLSIAICVPSFQENGKNPSQDLKSDVPREYIRSGIEGGGKGHLLVMVKDGQSVTSRHTSDKGQLAASSEEWLSDPMATFSGLLGMMPPLPPALVKYMSFPFKHSTVRSAAYDGALISYDGSDIIAEDNTKVIYSLGRKLDTPELSTRVTEARALGMLLVKLEEQSWNKEVKDNCAVGGTDEVHTDKVSPTCMLSPLSILELVEESLTPFYRRNGANRNSNNSNLYCNNVNKRNPFQRKTVLVVQNIDMASPAVLEVLYQAIHNGVVFIDEEINHNVQEKEYTNSGGPNSETEKKKNHNDYDAVSQQCTHNNLNHLYNSDEDSISYSSRYQNHSFWNHSSFNEADHRTVKMYPIPSITILATTGSKGFTALPAAVRESFLLSMVVSTASLALGLEKSNLPSTTRHYSEMSMTEMPSGSQIHLGSRRTADESAPMDRLVELLFTPRSVERILEDPRYVRCPPEMSNSLRRSMCSLQSRLMPLTNSVITKHLHRHGWIMWAVRVGAYLYGPSADVMKPKRRIKGESSSQMDVSRILDRSLQLSYRQLSQSRRSLTLWREHLQQYAALSVRDRRLERDKLLHLELIAGSLPFSSPVVGGSNQPQITDPSYSVIALHGRLPATVSYANIHSLLPHLLAHHIEVDELEYNIYCIGLARNCSNNHIAQLLSEGGYEQLLMHCENREMALEREGQFLGQEYSIDGLKGSPAAIGSQYIANLTAANLLLKCLTCCAIYINSCDHNFTCIRGVDSRNISHQPLDPKHFQKDCDHTQAYKDINNTTHHSSLTYELRELLAKTPAKVLVEYMRLLEVLGVRMMVSKWRLGPDFSNNPFYQLCASPSVGWDALAVHLDSMRLGYTQHTCIGGNNFNDDGTALNDIPLPELCHRHTYRYIDNPEAITTVRKDKCLPFHTITVLPSAVEEERFWKDQLQKIQEHYYHIGTCPNVPDGAPQTGVSQCNQSASLGDNTCAPHSSLAYSEGLYKNQWESALVTCWITVQYSLNALQPSNLPYHKCLSWIQEVIMTMGAGGR